MKRKKIKKYVDPDLDEGVEPEAEVLEPVKLADDVEKADLTDADDEETPVAAVAEERQAYDGNTAFHLYLRKRQGWLPAATWVIS